MTGASVYSDSVAWRLLEGSPHGVLVFTREHDEAPFVCEFANPAATVHFPGAIDRTLPGDWPRESADLVRKTCELAYDIGFHTAQLLIEDGSHACWVELDATRYDNAVQVYLTDLSPLGRAARDYAEMDSLFREANDLLCVIGHDGYLKRINPAFRRVLRTTEKTLLGTPFLELVEPEDRNLVIDAFEHAVSGSTPNEFEVRFRTTSDDVRWLAWSIAPSAFKMYAAARDVTEHRIAEEEARRRHDRFELAVHGSSAGLWDWDLVTGHVWRSPSFLRILGYEPDDSFPPVPEAWEIRLHPLDHEPIQLALARHLEMDIPYDVEYRLRTKCGGYKWVRACGTTVRDEDGQPVRMAGSIIDIDAQKRVEHDLARAKTAAEAANRAKSNFLANMSHEIRTPMTAILGYTDLLEDGDTDPDDRADYISTIRRNGDHLLALINDILDLSKIEANQMDVESISLSVPKLLGDLVELMRVRAEGKGIELEARFATAVPVEILSDPVRLRQILVNLLGNAIKFTESGAVRLILVFDRTSTSRSVLRFRVEDTGIGMSADQLGRLFQPFSQADASTTRRYGGTGLGLTISRHLAQLLGGDIEVTSRLGAGSTFDLVLPVRIHEEPEFVHELPDIREPKKPARRQQSEGVGRVLLAEDGPDNQHLIGHILRKAGYLVEVVDNGQEAVERLEADDSFDVVLMDMQMPVLDGYDATRLLREDGFELPIIALTAHAMIGDREKCLAAGCTDYTTKPVQRTALLALLDEYVTNGA